VNVWIENKAAFSTVLYNKSHPSNTISKGA
jgi:hypothetical protein